MALVGMWGFDDTSGESAAVGFPFATGPARGTAGLSWYSNSFGPGNITCTFSTVIAAANTSYIGFGWKSDSLGSNYGLYALFDNAAVMQLSVRLDASRHIQIYKGDGATLLATSTYQYPLNVWCYIEVKALIHSSTGVAEVRVDGAVVATFSGNTQQAAFTSLNSVRFGTAVASGSNATYVDDAYVLDSTGSAPYNTYLGDVAVRVLLPTGAGDLTQWTPTPSPNWDAVNESNSSTADYVSAPTTGLKDLYQMSDLPAGTVVLAIQNWIYAAKSDAGAPPSPSLIAKGDGGTTRTDSLSITLSTTFQHFGGPIYITDPDGDALTLTNTNAMQVGVST